MMKRWGILVVATGLVALTGCSAPAGEGPAATVTVTATPTESAAPAAAKIEGTPTPSSGSPRKLTKDQLDEYLGTTQQMMGGYGLDSREFTKDQILTESKKICAQGDDYKGLPKLNKVDGATGMLTFWADSNFC